MSAASDEHHALWRELMSVGKTVADLWHEIKKIEPHKLLAFASFAMMLGGELLNDAGVSFVERRRAALIAQLASHRVVFDLMGLQPGPDGDITSDGGVKVFFD